MSSRAASMPPALLRKSKLTREHMRARLPNDPSLRPPQLKGLSGKADLARCRTASKTIRRVLDPTPLNPLQAPRAGRSSNDPQTAQADFRSSDRPQAYPKRSPHPQV